MPIRRPSLIAREAALTVGKPEKRHAALCSTLALPHGAAGNWMSLAVSAGADKGWWAKITIEDRVRAQIVRETFLGPAFRRASRIWRRTLLHVPFEAGAARLEIYGPAGGDISARGAVLGRAEAAARLIAHGLAELPAALRGSPHGRLGRVRALLGQAPSRLGEAPPYALWLEWFGDRAESAPAQVPDAMLVLGQDGARLAAALAAARASNRLGIPRVLAVRPGESWPVQAGDWVVLLGEQERLAPGGLEALAARAGPDTDLIYGDVDGITDEGERVRPVFLPDPGPALLRSGLLARAACLVRWPESVAGLPRSPAAARLALSLGAWPRVSHVPAIVSSRCDWRQDETAAMSDVVSADLAGRGLAADIARAGAGLRVTLRVPGRQLVTAIVPSACRVAHVLPCLRAIEASTRGCDFELLVATSGRSAGERRLRRVLDGVAALPRTRILEIEQQEFNFSWVVNEAAREAAGDLLLLLNDDVAPAAGGWLERMMSPFAEPDVVATGARLLYGNGLVQHDGVVLGLANLVEHAGRLRGRSDPGPGGFAAVDREVSAVTAACLLVRAERFHAVGGLDPGFAVALNDVDFCLKLRAAGGRIVQCATAELYHYESLSLGRHYAGARAALEAVEVRRLRERWGAALAADPFYNPQASLEPGREWLPAFPPRMAGFSATLPVSSAMA